MSILSTLFKTGKAIARPVGKTASGGTIRRAAFGGVLGGMAGAFNDHEDTNQQLGSIARGAVLGAGAGALSRLFVPKLSFTAQGIKSSGMPVGWSEMSALASAFLPGRKAMYNMAGNAAKLGAGMLQHPVATAAVAGSVYGLSKLSGSLSYSPAMEYGNLDAIRDNTESSGMSNNSAMGMGAWRSNRSQRNNQLMASTYGLVQGLHNGRHF